MADGLGCGYWRSDMRKKRARAHRFSKLAKTLQALVKKLTLSCAKPQKTSLFLA